MLIDQKTDRVKESNPDLTSLDTFSYWKSQMLTVAPTRRKKLEMKTVKCNIPQSLNLEFTHYIKLFHTVRSDTMMLINWKDLEVRRLPFTLKG